MEHAACASSSAGWSSSPGLCRRDCLEAALGLPVALAVRRTLGERDGVLLVVEGLRFTLRRDSRGDMCWLAER